MVLETLYWEYHIIAYTVAGLLVSYLAFHSLKIKKSTLSKKQKRFRLMIGVFFILFSATILYGSFVAPRLYQVKTVNLNFETTKQTEFIKIVQLSDIHASYYKTSFDYQNIINKVKKIDPDIIVMTGDFINHHASEAEKLRIFSQLTQTYPTYAVTGNHEYGMHDAESYVHDFTEPLLTILKEMDVTVLDNKSTLISVNNKAFYLSGVKDIWSQDVEVTENLLDKMTKNNYINILLAHNPEVINYENVQNYDLILSGHTHGGQLRLPIIGTIPSLPTDLGRSYDKGLFELEENKYLYINAGTGESGPRARLFCRPEITVINLDL